MTEDGQLNWFGPSWGAPVCDPYMQVETPVGTRCGRCDEAIEDHETQGFIVPVRGRFFAPELRLTAETKGEAASDWIVFHRHCFIEAIQG